MPTVSPSAQAAVRAAIAQGAARTGADFGYLMGQAKIESGLDPAARARTSSATGLFQFTRSTWLDMLDRTGSAHGLDWASHAITRVGGRAVVADPATEAQLLELRFDPAVSSVMAGEYAAMNAATLQDALGRAPEPVDLYLAHFLGPAGATRFLTEWQANPDANAAGLFPDAAAANRAIFYDGGGPRTLDQIRQHFAAKLGTAAGDGAMPLMASAPPTAATALPRPSVPDDPRPLRLDPITPMPGRLSVELAQAAYARLAELG